MTFLRPEAVALLMRWRETLVGIAALGLGLWWVIGPGRLLAIPGAGLIIAGAALIWIGVQRARFRGPGDGAGQVQVDEGQISYFGPLTGGVMALRELDRLTLLKSMRPAHWQLDQSGQPPLLIPINALGADTLFDAFASLPGLKTERMLHELAKDGIDGVVVWERTSSRQAHDRLH